MKNNLSVAEAARLMGKSPQFVRIGLQRNLLPFGVALKNGSKYCYYISAKKFEEYTGINVAADDPVNKLKEDRKVCY